MKKQQIKRNGRVYNLVLATQQTNKYADWAQKIGIEQTGLKVKLPFRETTKTYNGVKLKNGKIAVYTQGGKVLRYAWT